METRQLGRRSPPERGVETNLVRFEDFASELAAHGTGAYNHNPLRFGNRGRTVLLRATQRGWDVKRREEY